MTDLKGFNPDNSRGVGFSANRQNGSGKPAGAPEGDETPEVGDPYANLKMTPDKLFQLLDAQSRMNIPAGVESFGIDHSVTSFGNAVSPDRHARVSRLFEQAYTQEFGTKPAPALLQDIVDDYLIGRVNIQGG